MKVLAHRGWWREPAEKNTLAALARAFDAGFGVETDVRDRAGTLVVSHDPPTGGEPTLAAFLDLLAGRDLPLALNVKADGLAGPLRAALAAARVRDAFVFDMSVPETMPYFAAGLPVYARLSEYEPESALLDRSPGVWLDAFHGPWWPPALLDALLARGKRVCVVSPELHGRPHDDLWRALEPRAAHPGLALCTDRPELARATFGGLQPSGPGDPGVPSLR